MTPVSTLSVFWVFLEALSEKQSAEELEATSSSFSLPLSLSGSGPEGHRESRENGTIKINVEMKLSYKERKTLSLRKTQFAFFCLVCWSRLLPPLSFFSFHERRNSRKTQVERTREKQEEKEKNKTTSFTGSHRPTSRPFSRSSAPGCSSALSEGTPRRCWKKSPCAAATTRTRCQKRPGCETARRR